MDSFEKVDLSKTIPRYLEILKIPYYVAHYAVKTTTASEKTQLISEQRDVLLQQMVEAGLIIGSQSWRLNNIDIFPIITTTARMKGQISMWGQDNTDLMISYTGTNRITPGEKLQILEILAEQPFTDPPYQKPSVKNLKFGIESEVNLAETGLGEGYVGPLYNHLARLIPVHLSRFYWDDHTDRPNNTALYELALDTQTGLFLQAEDYYTLRKAYFPQRKVYTRFSDEVGIPVPRRLTEG